MSMTANRNWFSAGALVLLAVLFLALTALSGALLKGARLDLTQNRLYTLSEGTRNLLGNIDEPINLYFFFSEENSRNLPQVRAYANRVEELLNEMSRRAGGRLNVQRIDPRPFSEAEDDAARFGLQAVPVGGTGDTLYLGIAGTNAVDGLEVLPFLSPNRESFLEYELARMIHVLSRPRPPRVGLLSGLPIGGDFDPMTQQRSEPWVIHEQINQMFEVETVRPQAGALPEDLDVLVLVHPADLSEDLYYAVDQFVLGGGRLLAFVDPNAEADPGPDPSDPMSAMMAERHSSLEPLFEAWGVEFDTQAFVADPGLALQVSMQQGQPPVRHPGILGIDRRHLDGEDVITAELDTLNGSSMGYFEVVDGATVNLAPLARSSAGAGALPSARLQWLSNPAELLNELPANGREYTLAARLSGTATSAFPERDDEGHIAEGEINAILVGDTDLLADRFWVQRQRFFGTSLLNPFANNGDFVINAIDNLLGNADLISLRSRATAARPFERVDDLRREAESNLRATERRLEDELQETENRLTELQQARGDADLAVLTREQEAEIDRFMQQRLEIRRQLRQVRRDLDQDIRALGGRLKVINIALMPVLITGLALALAWRRRRRQQAAREVRS